MEKYNKVKRFLHKFNCHRVIRVYLIVFLVNLFLLYLFFLFVYQFYEKKGFFTILVVFLIKYKTFFKGYKNVFEIKKEKINLLYK